MALQGFDEAYYLQAKLAALVVDHPEWDGKTAADLKTVMQNLGMTPEQHYMEHGYKEGLQPNAYFNAAEYTAAKAQQLFDKGLYMTVADAKAAFEAAWPGNPYEHYIRHGADEDINPSNAFDASSYMAAKLASLQAADPAKWGETTVEQLTDIFIEQGFTPLTHYMEYGREEGIAVVEVPADEQVNPDSTGGTPGETFTLTKDEDNIVGTRDDDTINAPTKGGVSTLGAVDRVDGGDGDDTMSVTVTGAIDPASIKNVENIELRSVAAGASIDLSNAQGVEKVTVAESTGTITVSGVGTIDTFEVSNQTQDVTIEDGKATKLDLTLDGFKADYNDDNDKATALDLTVSGSETAFAFGATAIKNITVDAAGKNVLETLEQLSVENLVVSGSGSVDFVDGHTALKTLDASANEGGVTAAVDATATKVTGGTGDDNVEYTEAVANTAVVKLGDGDDRVALADVTKGAAIDGGGGDNDSLGLSAAAFVTVNGGAFGDAGRALLTNFENLAITERLADGSVYDLDNFGSFTSFTTLGLNVGDGSVLQNVKAGVDVNVNLGNNNSGVLDIQLKDATGSSDALNLILSGTNDAANQVAQFKAEGIETLNVDVKGDEDATVEKIELDLTADTTKLQTLNLTGDAKAEFTADAGQAALKTVDASGNKAGAVIDVSSIETVTVTGTAKADTITLQNKATVTGGDGKDGFVLMAGSDAVSVSTITDFGKDDKLVFDTNFEAALGDAFDYGNPDANSLKDVIEAANADAGNNAQWFAYKGNTYITMDHADDAVAEIAAVDTVIKLTGVYDLKGSGEAGSANFELAEDATVPA